MMQTGVQVKKWKWKANREDPDETTLYIWYAGMKGLCLFVLRFMAQSTQWGHVEHGQFT